jgi:hypothetical protein
MEGWDRHPSTRWVHSILNFEPWMSLRDSKFTLSRGNANLIVHYKLWMSILKFDIFSVDILSIKLSFLLIVVMFSWSQCNVITAHVCLS